ncbi:lipid-A-disaccharide synthase [Aureimonas sp. AU20]|uniref:lipid-A-disaccharide synthase n=1 Tax=Aureimonas sp. AU20 TaxID=1349819 RepID=UPI00071F2166|nr:lipid-A-disaccharide synthase [Aureimonas sp. AU20]ALN73280.1 hypothetical protein M673_11175 [Aureimonas sp. AU20]
MKIAFVLGEESADRIAGEVARALRDRFGPSIQFIGLGGDALKREGLTSLFDIEELSIIGVGAILSRLPKLLGRLRQTVDFLLEERPDAIVTIDSFTFTNRVALKVRQRWPDARIVNVVPPAIWAYKPKRAETLRQAVDHSASLFPFEPRFLEEHGGPPATYVGHPLLSDPRLRAILDREAETGMRPPGRPPHLVILPGSRRGEIERLMDDFGRTYALLHQGIPGLRASLPAVRRVRSLIESKLESWSVKPEVLEGDDAKWAAFASADAALAASGTVSLELALAGVPMALAYRLDPVSYALRHMVTGWTAALPNFIAGHPLVPEHFHEFVRPEALALRLDRLMHETPERAAQLKGMEDIRQAMRVDRPPGEAIADLIVREIERSGRP